MSLSQKPSRHYASRSLTWKTNYVENLKSNLLLPIGKPTLSIPTTMWTYAPSYLHVLWALTYQTKWLATPYPTPPAKVTSSILPAHWTDNVRRSTSKSTRQSNISPWKENNGISLRSIQQRQLQNQWTKRTSTSISTTHQWNYENQKKKTTIEDKKKNSDQWWSCIFVKIWK